MLRFILAAVLASLALAPALAQDRVGEVSTTFRVVGPNDKVVIDRFDDPKVENASCYVSRAEIPTSSPSYLLQHYRGPYAAI